MKFKCLNQRIVIPCSITVVEQFEEKDNDSSTKGVIIKGELITCGIPTRNGISYSKESMARFVSAFNQSGMTLPFLDSHDDTSIRRTPPFGHLTGLSMQGDKVFYVADIDPEEKTFLHKLRRGDIKEVSLQAIVDSVGEQESLDGGDNVILADVRELLEVSSVLIPGARGTSIEIQESLGFLSEQRFVETYKNAKNKGITFKESHRVLLKEHYGTRQSVDDNKIMGGQITEPKEEDLTTANGSALIAPALSKKVKKVPEFLREAKRLKIITKRFNN